MITDLHPRPPPAPAPDFWPRRIAMEINTILITHPGINTQPWFEHRLAQRELEMAAILTQKKKLG